MSRSLGDTVAHSVGRRYFRSDMSRRDFDTRCFWTYSNCRWPSDCVGKWWIVGIPSFIRSNSVDRRLRTAWSRNWEGIITIGCGRKIVCYGMETMVWWREGGWWYNYHCCLSWENECTITASICFSWQEFLCGVFVGIHSFSLVAPIMNSGQPGVPGLSSSTKESKTSSYPTMTSMMNNGQAGMYPGYPYSVPGYPYMGYGFGAYWRNLHPRYVQPTQMYGNAYNSYYNAYQAYGNYYGYGQTPVDTSSYSTSYPSSVSSTTYSQSTVSTSSSTPGGA